MAVLWAMTRVSEVEVDRGASEGNNAVEVVVGAANRLRRARVSRDTDGGDGAAIHANEASDILDDNSQGVEERGNRGVGGGLDAIAAVKSAGIALIGGTTATVAASGGGSSKGSESKSRESREL